MILGCLLLSAWAQVPVTLNMKSFSSAIKGGHLAGAVEKILYERNTGQPGVITEQWFTGKSQKILGFCINFFCRRRCYE